MTSRRSFLQASMMASGGVMLGPVDGTQAGNVRTGTLEAQEREGEQTAVSTEFLTPPDQHLQIGAIVFPEMDQIDLTGPFSVLARLPNSSIQLLWKEPALITDHLGLKIMADAALADAKPIDVLLVPGGPGQEALMEDATVLGFLATQARSATLVFSVCTGSLICGAAGLLQGRSATTHWASLHLLKYFGAVTSRDRVVVDGKYVSAAGLTAGIDGALRVAALLRGDDVARGIQLGIQYAPEPPYQCGSPETAPAELVEKVTASTARLRARRLETARRVARTLQVTVDE